MSIYMEPLVIFIFCTFLYPAENINSHILMIILTAFIMTCFSLIAKKTPTVTALTSAAFIICLFYPNFTCFFPALCYKSCYHRKYIFPALAVLLVFYNGLPYSQGIILIFALLLSPYLACRNREREYLENAVKRLRDNSVEQEMRLKKRNEWLLANQDDEIYIATLKERNRIAREIHDSVGHMLSRSLLQVGALLTICKDEMLKAHLESLKNSLDTAMDNIRSSVHDLHDESVDLKSSLQGLVDGFSFCDIHFDCDTSRHVPKEIKYCFIAITKEALNNIIKHSNATRVSITVKEHPGLYQLFIADNGTIPFSITDTSGIGLANMKERADTLHGILRITTEKGVKIFLSIPK